MIRLLFVIPLCALAPLQATARNDPSEILLAQRGRPNSNLCISVPARFSAHTDKSRCG